MNVMNFASEKLHVSLSAENVFSVGGLDIKNSVALGLIFYVLLAWLIFATVRTVKGKMKPNFLTRVTIWIFESLHKTVEDIIGDKKMSRRIAPLSISIFIFVIMQYWSGILPFVGPITNAEGVPIFRSMVADLNTTFALAIITIVAAQVFAIQKMGLGKNLGRYWVNPLKSPIGAFVGLLEFVAELSRMLGLSFRLFGNVFAGEILLVVIASLTRYFGVAALPPFYLFEFFIGAVQAYIFFMLTTIFASLGLVDHGDHDDASHINPIPISSHQTVSNKPATADEII